MKRLFVAVVAMLIVAVSASAQKKNLTYVDASNLTIINKIHNGGGSTDGGDGVIIRHIAEHDDINRIKERLHQHTEYERVCIEYDFLQYRTFGSVNKTSSA